MKFHRIFVFIFVGMILITFSGPIGGAIAYMIEKHLPSELANPGYPGWPAIFATCFGGVLGFWIGLFALIVFTKYYMKSIAKYLPIFFTGIFITAFFALLGSQLASIRSEMDLLWAAVGGIFGAIIYSTFYSFIWYSRQKNITPDSLDLQDKTAG